MADTLATGNFDYQNFFGTTLSADITDTATDIFLNTIPTPNEGMLVIDPYGTNREIIFFNSKTGSKVIVPSGGRGYDNTTAVSHTSGTQVIMSPTAQMFRDLKNGSAYDSIVSSGWINAGETWNYSANNSNKEYLVTVTGDKTGKYQPGHRVKIPRTIAPPTQCADLESTSSQYANKTSPTGITFTAAFTCESWVRLESYTGVSMGLVAKFSTNGFRMYLNADGQLVGGYASGGVETSFTTYRAIPLDNWTHVALSVSSVSSKTAILYVNGVAEPFTTTGSATALTQAGDLIIGIGGNGSSAYMDGKLADVRIWNIARTQSQIRENMNQALIGTETGLVAYFPLNGNFNDSTTNANNLTPNGSVVATNIDNPMKAIEYGIVTKVSYDGVSTTTITLFTGTEFNIPNQTLGTPQWSMQKSPFGFPASRVKWASIARYNTQYNMSGTSWSQFNGHQISVPAGQWLLGYDLPSFMSNGLASMILSTSTPGVGADDTRFESRFDTPSAGSNFTRQTVRVGVDVPSQTIYKLYQILGSGAGGLDSDQQLCQLIAECAYV